MEDGAEGVSRCKTAVKAQRKGERASRFYGCSPPPLFVPTARLKNKLHSYMVSIHSGPDLGVC